MELELKNYPYKENKISFTIKEKEINGISSYDINEIIDWIKNNHNYKKIDHKEIKESEWNAIKRQMVVVSKQMKDNIHEETIEHLMMEYMKQRDIYPRNLSKKIKDSMRIVGLPESILERGIYTLSTSEQKLVQIAISLLSNPDMILLEEPFQVLDLKNRKKIMMILKKIKDQYKKTIVILSTDPECLLKETDHLIIIKNHKVLLEDKTLEIYKQVDFLKKHRVELPDIIEFTYLARKMKNIKIDYYKDIRDIIKDIYKHG